MPQLSRILRVFSVFAFLACSFPWFARAGTWVAFQNSYTRGTGTPVTVTDTFTLLNPNTQYTLKAFNGGLQNDTTELVSNSVVYLNGAQVVGPSNFNQSVAEVNVTILPGLTNTLSVQVRGKPGGVLTIQVIGVDNDPPTITASVSPAPNSAGWNNSPVTVTFTCSDKTSGVASCPSPVTVGTEGANQVVSGTATDLAGNTTSTSVTINLDMTPPTITGTINPAPDAGGYNSGPVTVTFSCADALSGVASCSPAVSVSGEGSFPETGTAVDVAGNSASATITVNISLSYFKIRSWQTNPAGDPSQTGKCLDYGATIFLNDCSLAHAIRVAEIAPRDQKDSQGNTIPLCSSQDNPPPNPPAPHTLCHEVLLFAGSGVIGVFNPLAINPGGTPAPPQPVTEYQLEVQAPFFSPRGAALFTAAQQIWRLDGDSIILEGSHVELQTNALLPVIVEVPGPCINTVTTIPPLCPDPPPQLAIQVENSRGANGSPLVATVRNLSDNEFWDFVPLPGSRPYPTTGFVSMIAPPGDPTSSASATPITMNWQLWNAICASPQANSAGPTVDNNGKPVPCSVFNPGMGWGSVVVVAGSDPNECTSRPDVGPCIDFTGYAPIGLHAGMTIRGNRRGSSFGPQLFASYTGEGNFSGLCANCVFDVQGDYVRVTGLRLHGQDHSTDAWQFKTDGILIDYAGSAVANPGPPPQDLPLGSVTQVIATIDHNDMSDWWDAAVTINSPFTQNYSVGGDCNYPGYIGPGFNNTPNNYQCDEHVSNIVPYSSSLGLSPVTIGEDPIVSTGTGTLANARVARNFLHHNMRDHGGYGVGVQGRALIDGNTFVWNRHDISSDADPHHEYRAAHNLVLSSAYDNYGGFWAPFIGRLQDFDMHGTSNTSGGLFVGGAGGYYVEIDGNTFLGRNGHDYALRGYPVANSYYHHNVSLRNENDAVHFLHCTDPIGCVNDYHCLTALIPCDFPIDISSDSQFADSYHAYTDPTTRFGPTSLGVGDFDGDGDDDLFLATGVAWYYSPRGQREWRFLNAAPDTIDQLLLGDFDGDGRTDVVAMRSGQLVVSWGGISAFDVLNYNPCTNVVPVTCPSSVADLAVGDFDGDGKPDIFWADGANWWVSFGGNTPFVQVQSSSFHVSDLRFGDFNNDGTTDVLGVVGYAGSNYYQLSYSPKGAAGALFSGWTPLQPALTNSASGVVVADFNADGVADVLAPSSDGWQISEGGSQPWTDVPQPSLGPVSFSALAGVGHFTGQRQVDVLMWNGIPYLPPPLGANQLSLSFTGVASPATPYSTQDMR